MNYHVKQFYVKPTNLDSGETLSSVEVWLAQESSDEYDLHSMTLGGTGAPILIVVTKQCQSRPSPSVEL